MQSRQWQVTLVPYAATTVHLPPGVGPGGIFQFSHPGSTQRYLVAGPANAAPNLPVELMIPPAHIPNASDRVDVLTNLTGTDNTPAANSIDTNGDGIPDAAPFIPGQDGYVTVLQEQGSSDRLTVYVPATSLLTLKHVVDAIDSWGETSMSTRYDSNTLIIDTVSHANLRSWPCHDDHALAMAHNSRVCFCFLLHFAFWHHTSLTQYSSGLQRGPCPGWRARCWTPLGA